MKLLAELLNLNEGMWVVKSFDGVEKRFKDRDSAEAKEWARSIKKKPQKVKAPKYSQEWWEAQDPEVSPWEKIDEYRDSDEIQRIAAEQFGKAMDDWSVEKKFNKVVNDVDCAHATIRVTYTYGPEDDMGHDEEVSDAERIVVRRDIKKPEKLVFAGF